MPIFTFVRHAEALHNADHRVRGDIAYRDPANRDAALTPTGIQQTQRKMPHHVDKDYDIIYCSPLQRCRQTLLGIYPGAWDRPVRMDDRLMEPQGDHTCNWRIDKEVLATIVPQKWDLSGVGDTNPGQQPRLDETSAEFRKRIHQWTVLVSTIYSENTRILVVTHYMWTRAWSILHRDEAIGLANCESITVRWPPKKLTPSPTMSPTISDNNDE